MIIVLLVVGTLVDCNQIAIVLNRKELWIYVLSFFELLKVNFAEIVNKLSWIYVENRNVTLLL